MRLFSAVTVNDNTANAAVYVFGGYSVAQSKKIKVWG